MLRGAEFDGSGRYRYVLWRAWGDAAADGDGNGWREWGPRAVVFVMLNPSTADAERDDPTIRTCMGLARAWGFGGLVAVNLFAWRCTDPRRLQRVRDPVGTQNDPAIRAAAAGAAMRIAAWGNWGRLRERGEAVMELLRECGPVHCLGVTKLGQPRHPLYTARGTMPRLWVDPSTQTEPRLRPIASSG